MFNSVNVRIAKYESSGSFVKHSENKIYIFFLLLFNGDQLQRSIIADIYTVIHVKHYVSK